MNPRDAAAPGGQPGAGGSCDGDTTSVTRRPDKTLTFAQCLDLLDLHDDEWLSFGTEPRVNGRFHGRQFQVGHLKALDLAAYENHNVWCGLQPMRKVAKRGGNVDVLRIAALFADLDIDPQKIPTYEALVKVVDLLSDMVGDAPVYVTFSGHGFQPVWKVDPDDSADLDLMLPLLGRWGQLVKQVAVTCGGTADGVFDPARLLRVPDTTNWKNPQVPVGTWAAVRLS